MTENYIFGDIVEQSGVKMTPTRENRNADEGGALAPAQAGAHTPAHAQHTTAHVYGIAYAIRDAYEGVIKHVIESEGTLANCTNANLVFYVIGFNATCGRCPAIARNKVTGEWVYASALIWTDAWVDSQGQNRPAGFYWGNGHYYQTFEGVLECFNEDNAGAVPTIYLNAGVL